MRSDLVFAARGRVGNPFLLFHLLRISSRRCHKSGTEMQATINKVLTLLGEQTCMTTGANANAVLAELVGHANES
jgi:hypothetical protein